MAEQVDFLYLHGSADGDVDMDFASRFLNLPGLSEQHFRAGFWIYGANHSYFNSDWARSTGEFPVSAVFRLTPEEQQRLCRVVVSAFLHVSFDIEPGYRGFLEDWRTGYHWLPNTIYTTRWHSGQDMVLADFSEDADPRTAGAPGWQISAQGFSLWREGKLPAIATGYFYAPEISARDTHTMHQNSHAVFLRGSEDQTAEYRLNGPTFRSNGLRFDIGAHPPATADQDTEQQLLKAEIVIELDNGQMLTYQLTELGSIPITPATFHLLRWSSRYYAPQTIQISFPEEVNLIGLRFRFPPGSDLEWHIDRIAAIQEGVIQ